MNFDEIYSKGYFESGQGSNYQGYEDWPFFKERAEWLVKTYKPTSVFEIGTAKGFMLDYLQEMGVDAWGVEVSSYARNEAKLKDKIFRADFFAGDMTEPIDKYDLVVSFDVLEHIPQAQVDNVIKMLKKAKRQFHMITTTEYDFHGDDTHYSSYPKQWWLDKFEEFGVKNYDIIHAGEQEGLIL